MLLLGLLLTGCSREGDASQVINRRVVISEVMSTNSYYAPLPDGDCCDWVELHNTSDQSVNLKGCTLSDSAGIADKWKVPCDCVVAPDGYVLIYLSGRDAVDEAGNLHADFKLSSKGESLVLRNAVGDVVQQITIPECTVQNISFGLSDGGKYRWFAQPSPGLPNGGNTAERPEWLEFPSSGLELSEYMTKNTYVIYDSNNQYSDWVEIHNTTDHAVHLRGYSLSDSDDGTGQWSFPSDAVIEPDEYMLIFCTDLLSTQEGVYHADFRLSGGERLMLFGITGKAEDSVEVKELAANISCGRDPESGEWRLFASPTPGRANTTYSFASPDTLSSASGGE